MNSLLKQILKRTIPQGKEESYSLIFRDDYSLTEHIGEIKRQDSFSSGVSIVIWEEVFYQESSGAFNRMDRMERIGWERVAEGVINKKSNSWEMVIEERSGWRVVEGLRQRSGVNNAGEQRGWNYQQEEMKEWIVSWRGKSGVWIGFKKYFKKEKKYFCIK